MLLYLRGRPLWFRRMNTPELVEALLAYAREVADGGAPALQSELASRSFSWTSGGRGPEPPIADAEPRGRRVSTPRRATVLGGEIAAADVG